jgi:hypothetical protein
MRHIAASKPVGDVTILESLAELERDLGQNTSLVVITSSSDGSWVEALGGLARRGVRVSTVLIDRGSYGGASNRDALDHLTAVGISTYSMGRGDSIASALLSRLGGNQEGLRQASVRAHSGIPEVTQVTSAATVVDEPEQSKDGDQ